MTARATLLVGATLLLAPSSAAAKPATAEVICLGSPCAVLVDGQLMAATPALQHHIPMIPGTRRVVGWDQTTGMRQIKIVTVHDGWHSVRVVFNLRAAHDDAGAPMISHSPCDDFGIGDPFTVEAIFHDEREVYAPRVWFRFDGAKQWLSLPLAPQERGHAATLPTPPGAVRLSYYLEAFDDLGNGPGELGNAEAPIVLSGRAIAAECDQLGSEMKPSELSVMTVGRSGCSVFVAGLDVGVAPMFKKLVQPGEHEVKVSCPDGKLFLTRRLFEDGKAEKLIIKPEMFQ